MSIEVQAPKIIQEPAAVIDLAVNGARARLVQEDAEVYHANTAWNSRGMLDDFNERHRLYEKCYIHGKRVEKKRSDEMQLGTLCHAVLLEGRAVEDCVTIIPREVLNSDGHRKGSAWTAYKKANADRVLMSELEAAEALAMVNSVLNHPTVGEWHKVASYREASIYWTENGMQYRCKPDWLILGSGLISIDFKTAKDASHDGMRKAIRSFYAFQQVHYSRGIKAKFGEDPTFLFVCVDSCEPYTTYVHGIDAESLKLAEEDWLRTTTELRACIESGNWSDGENEIQWHEFSRKEYEQTKGW
jgi:hypothetical protein